MGCLQRWDPREGPSSPCTGRQRAPPRSFAKIAHVFLSGLGATKMRGSAVIGVTEAVARGNWLWRCLRTCAVACRRRLRDVMAQQNVVGPDPRLGDPSSPGWLSARPKTPAGARRRLSIQTETRTKTLASPSAIDPCLTHLMHDGRVVLGQNTRLAGYRFSQHKLAAKAFAAAAVHATPTPGRTIGVESLSQPSFGALHFFAVTRLLQAKSRGGSL